MSDFLKSTATLKGVRLYQANRSDRTTPARAVRGAHKLGPGQSGDHQGRVSGR